MAVGGVSESYRRPFSEKAFFGISERTWDVHGAVVANIEYYKEN